jgi:hypothetical protein
MQFEFNAPSLGPPNRISGFYQENHVGIKVVRHLYGIQEILLPLENGLGFIPSDNFDSRSN